jgi:hypothetical protein
LKIKVFDIETSAENARVDQWVNQQPCKVKVFEITDPATATAPASFKDKDKIAERIATNKAKIIKANEEGLAKYKKAVADEKYELRNKAALSWYTGAQVISVAFEDLATDKKVCFAELDEKKLLIQVGDYLHAHPDHKIAGQFSEAFDRPFLIFCFMRHDLGVPANLSNSSDYRPVLDLQHIGSYSGKNNQVASLNKMAYGLGIEGKNGSGGDVAKLHKRWVMSNMTGDTTAREELIDYNQRDVTLTKEIFKRFHKVYVPSVDIEGDKMNQAIERL